MNIIRVLLLEDDPQDAEALANTTDTWAIQFETTVVSNPEDYEIALASGSYDLILCGYHSETYNGAAAVKKAAELQPDIPAIVISNARVEEQHQARLAQEQKARGKAETSKAHFRALFESAPGLYLVVKPPDYHIVDVSEAYLRSTQTKRRDIIGKPIFDVFPNGSKDPEVDTTAGLRASLERVKTLGRADVMAVQHYPIPVPESEKGEFEERYWSPLNSPVFDRTGELAYIIHRVEDVTDFVRIKHRRDNKSPLPITLETRAEKMEADIVLRSQELERLNNQLRQSEERFRELTENIEEVFFHYDPKHDQLQYVNPAFDVVWGRSRDSLYSAPEMLLRTVHPEDAVRTKWSLLRCMAGQDRSFECRIQRADSEFRWIDVHLSCVRNLQGRLHHIVATVSDITARKLAELKLARSNRALRMTTACTQALIRAEDETSLLEEICEIAVDIGDYQMAWIGYAQDDESKAITPVAHAGDEADYLANINLNWSENTPLGQGPAGRTIRSGQPTILEDIRNDESFLPWLLPAAKRGYRGLISLPLSNEMDTFGVLVLYSKEIRPVHADEVKLLGEFADNLSYGIGVIRSEQYRKQLHTSVLKVAAAVSASTGVEFFQQLVRNMAEALNAKAGFMARNLPGQPITARTIAATLNGKVIDNIDYLIADSPCKNLLRTGYWLEPCKISENFPSSPGGVVHGESYVGMRLNSSDGQLLGQLFVVFDTPLKQTDFIVSTLKIFAARAAAELERREADARIREQASLLDKAHDAVIVSDPKQKILFWNKAAERLYGWSESEALGSSKTMIYKDPAPLIAASNEVMEHGEWRGRMVHYSRNGRKLNVESHWTLVRDEDGNPKSILAINSDISKRLAMEEQLQQAQRLKAVGELTGGVAHDFNNLLTVILGNSELLVEQLADKPQLKSLMEMTLAAARRGATLTHRLLAFSRRQVLEPEPVNANSLIASMDSLLRRTLREDISIKVRSAPDLWDALVDPAPLEAALLNLCINARDAMDGGGDLTITTKNVVLDDENASQSDDITPGPYIMIEVADTGRGISEHALTRVFEPFYTTKAKGEGTGLGLSIVYGFIKQSQGHIVIDSEEGEGTQVKMYLPRATHVAESIRESAISVHELRGSEKILLVEDDNLVRHYAENQLLALGYSVVSAENGPDALARIRQESDIDLLFTDVIMPGGLNGVELADQARQLRPELNVLYTSGYTESVNTQGHGLDRPVHILNKPYSRLNLARKIRAVISESQTAT